MAGVPGFRHSLPRLLLVLPLTAFLCVFYAYPVVTMLLRSVQPGVWTFSAFTDLAGSGVFWRVMDITLEVSVIVTICSLLLPFRWRIGSRACHRRGPIC